MLVNYKRLNVAIDRAKSCVAKNETFGRKFLESYHVFAKDNILTIESCDGFKLVTTDVYIINKNSEEDFDVLVAGLEKVNQKFDVSIQYDKATNTLKINDKNYKCTTDNFIQTEPIIKEEKSHSYIDIGLNPRYLAKLVATLKEEDKYKPIVMRVDVTKPEISPVRFYAKDTKALLLPIRMPK